AATRAWPSPRDTSPRGCPDPAPGRRPRPPAARTAGSTAAHFPRARPVQGPALLARRAIPALSGGSARASGPPPPPPAPPARPRPAVRSHRPEGRADPGEPTARSRPPRAPQPVRWTGPPAPDRPRAGTGPDRAAPARSEER